jgi:hypothetical protein
MGRRLVLFGYVAALAGVACRDEADVDHARFRDEPTPLIDGFMSRQRAFKVEKSLRDIGISVTILEDGATHGHRSRMRPSLSVRVVSATGFSYLGVRGDLRMEFVDDELAATWFYPDNADRFESEIGKRYPAITSGGAILLQPATELRAGVDYRALKYWVWEDIALRHKIDSWIRTYA